VTDSSQLAGGVAILSDDQAGPLGQARQLLDSIDVAEPSGLRDRTLIGVMVYSFARVSAAAMLRVEDYFEHGERAWLRIHEKGRKRHEVPCHHNLAVYRDAWIGVAAIAADKKGPLFRAIRKGNKLEPDGAVGRSRYDQKAHRWGRPALFHLRSHISRDRHYNLYAKWRNPRARAADCPT
jgi:integrase